MEKHKQSFNPYTETEYMATLKTVLVIFLLSAASQKTSMPC